MSTTPTPTPAQARAFLYALRPNGCSMFTETEVANMNDEDVLLYADLYGMRTADDATGEKS